jgi:hypothetical protein
MIKVGGKAEKGLDVIKVAKRKGRPSRQQEVEIHKCSNSTVVVGLVVCVGRRRNSAALTELHMATSAYTH